MAAETNHLDALEQFDGLKGLNRVSVPQGRYGGFKVEYDADNKSGDQVNPEDLGPIRIKRGDQILSLRQKDLFELQDERKVEKPEVSGTDGGTSRLVTYIENGIFGELSTNGFNVTDDESFNLIFDMNSVPGGGGTLNSLANSLTVTVRPLINPTVLEQVQPVWNAIPLDFGGATTKEVDGMEERHIAAIYIDDPDGVVKAIDLKRFMPQGVADEIKYNSTPVKQVEEEHAQRSESAGDSALIGVPVQETPSAVDARNAGVTLKIETSGSTQSLRVLYSHLDSPINAGDSPVRTRARSLSGMSLR